MRRLCLSLQHWQRRTAMNKYSSPNVRKQVWASVPSGTITEAPSGQLEVNVIFTDREETIAALKTAKSLARDLGARIRLLAAIVVPLRLPLDQPQVSVQFMEQLLQDLMIQTEQDESEMTVELYVCRDWFEALSRILHPDSLIVLATRRRWWTTPTSRLAQALRAQGHRVALVDSKRPGGKNYSTEVESKRRGYGAYPVGTMGSRGEI
jgi:hypothetical protein